MSREILRTSLGVAGGVAAGALTMYFYDPDHGRRRRALCMDQLNSAAGTVKEAVESTAHDLTNRARGLVAEARPAVTGGSSPTRETTEGGLAAA